MSYVSTVTLICGFGETDDETGRTIADKLNAYGGHEHGLGFTNVAMQYGGSKFAQQFVFGAGINYLGDEQAFADYVMRLGWRDPESVVLLIDTEDQPTRIWRPLGGNTIAFEVGKWSEIVG